MNGIRKLLAEAMVDDPPPRVRAAMKSLLREAPAPEQEEEPPQSPPSEGERAMHLDWDFREETEES